VTINMNREDTAISVWIQGPGAGSMRAMLASCKTLKFKPANTVLASDMVLYTGGSDVSPSLYNETILGCSFVDFARDRDDSDCFTVARRSNKFQVGICRGSQFLNVMNGGQLWQDVDGHAGKNHLVQDILSDKTYMVSSTHHQQIILNTELAVRPKLLAWAEESERKLSAKGCWRKESGRPSTDVEAYWYPHSRCLGVQWHPEFGPRECTDLFFSYIEKYYNEVEHVEQIAS
jgi:gamma-glutamyl-gamma-aminobutyrate hydrolase PuuD